jgi:DNA-binding NarL/FixJ family response regulator
MKRRPTRILLVDDHEIVRRGLRSLLQARPDWEICGEAKDGLSAVALARELRPNVVVIDISMPRMNGLEALIRIRKSVPDAAVIMLTVHDNEEMISRAIVAGAIACVSKTDEPRHLIAAIEAAVENRPYFTSDACGIMLDRVLAASRSTAGGRSESALTAREREIVRLLAEGLTNKKIAALLDLAVPTVQGYRTKIMRKLGVDSLADVVRYAIRTEMIEP